jgi:DNA-binding CsgD family transcriptional regulator
MVAALLGRPAESRAIADFLESVKSHPSAMVVEGEAGIGKTTVWLAAVDSALQSGFEVLSARPAAAESVLAYGALADMLGELDEGVWADIPAPQRLAFDAVLFRTGEEQDQAVIDPRALAAGFMSLVKRLAQVRPVLLAIDDLQWLDSSSLQVVAFAARRLSGRAGVLGTVRTDSDDMGAATWLQLPRLAEVNRIRLGPLSLGGLRAVVSERLGRSLSRSAMVRIHEVSQGNPFYALEVARTMDEDATSSGVRLPGSLADLVRTRVDRLGTDVQRALLAASCVATPTVELVALATGADAEQVVSLLGDAEDKGIVEIEGHRLHFTHPLLARGVYTQASPARRREMHRCLADIVEEPELQARHLAMAVAWGDPRTLERLDRAAEIARNRGAPAAAAELLDLAIGLGGDSPERRIRSAGHHFHAGDNARARTLLEGTIGELAKGPLRAQALSLLASLSMAVGSFVDAAEVLKRALGEVDDNLALRVQMLVMRSFALTNGDLLNAEQYSAAARSAEEAVTTATRLGQPHLLSQALGMSALHRFLRGEGLDQPTLQRALDLEDREADIALAMRPSMHNAVLLAWTGQLDRASKELRSIRQRCIERGQESEMMFLAVHCVQTEIWRGNFSEATRFAEDAMDRALQLGDDMALFVGHAGGAACAAHTGHVDRARADISEALAASKRCATRNFILWVWVVTTAGFLEVSLGNYPATVTVLEPLLSTVEEEPRGTEIVLAAFLPDAAEALIHLRRLDEAEPLIQALEHNGRRLDRAWMLAVGARCRSMMLAARGDLEAAGLTAEQAMLQHERLAMPFERARTQLVLAQLQRRQRHRDAATRALREALETFERVGSPLWADRARAELTRTDVASGRAGELTVAEQRVAELAASGMTNHEVAAALFIRPKTVEANLVRIYRKLGIHSRAELGRAMAQSDSYGNT